MPATSVAPADIAVSALEQARRFTLRLAQDIPDAGLLHRPGGIGPHALWLMGHMAWTDDYFTAKLGGRQGLIPESWSGTFGMGSEVTTDADNYPSRNAVMEALEQTRGVLIDWARSLDTEQMAAPLPEELQDFAPNLAGLFCSLAWHEGLHAGQLIEVRRSLGLGRAFG